MFCEKCGKKVSYRKTQCDHCKHPIEYEGFSKFEYEKVAASTSVVSTASTPLSSGVRTASAPRRKKGRLIAVVSVAAVLVLAVIIVCAVMFTKDKSVPNPENNPAEALAEIPEYDIKISADAKISVMFEKEPLEKYTYIVEIISEKSDEENSETEESEQSTSGSDDFVDATSGKADEMSSISPDKSEKIKYSTKFVGDENSEGKLCDENKALKPDTCYKVTVKGDGKKTKDKTVVVLVSDGKDAKSELIIDLEGYSAEELPEEELDDIGNEMPDYKKTNKNKLTNA